MSQRNHGRCHIQCRVSSICKRSTASVDADSNTANQVAHADSQACPEQRETRIVGLGIVQLSALDTGEFGGEDDGHDDAVDGDDFAENNGDQVLGSDAWGADTTADDGGTGNENTPGILLRSACDLGF